MITEFIKKRVLSISNEDEFMNYISSVQMSSASLNQREEVIEYAKKVHSNLIPSKNSHENILKLIEESSADIDDIN